MIIINGKKIYFTSISSRAVALRVARTSVKTWVATHPTVPGFMLVRPVDAGRLEKAGGSIVVEW